MSFGLWISFLLASIVISITPGPGSVLVLATSLRYRYTSVFKTLLGLELALLVHLAIVALGLGALLATSNAAFLTMKIMGAAYLVWLGIQKWRAPVESIDATKVHVSQSGRLFRQGLLVNLTNPKAVIFIAALLPQFIVVSEPQVAQYIIIGATMVGVDLLIMTGYALLASQFRHFFKNTRMLRIQNRIFGGLFVSAGIMLASSSR